MNWKEFKDKIEAQGIKDTSEIDHIDWRYGDPMVFSIGRKRSGLFGIADAEDLSEEDYYDEDFDDGEDETSSFDPYKPYVGQDEAEEWDEEDGDEWDDE